MAPPKKSTCQVTFRVDVRWLGRADALAKKLSRTGHEATRTDAIRVAIARGFEVLEAER